MPPTIARLRTFPYTENAMGDVELEMKVEAGELRIRDLKSGENLRVFPAFWRALAEALEKSGYPNLARPIFTALELLEETEKLTEESLRCMEAGLSPEEARRCREILIPKES